MNDWPARTGRILETLQSLLSKRTAPLADSHFRHVQFAGNLLIAFAGGSRQDNPTSLHHALRSGRGSH
jgi:hypothetical protein